MPRDDYPFANQALFTPGYNTEWNPVPSLPMPTLQSNALAESDGWPQFLGPAAALSVSTPDIMAKVGDFNYAQRLNSFNLNAPVPTGHPSAMGEVGNYNQEFTSYMPSVHPNGNYGMKMLDNTPTTNRAPSLLVIDANGASPSFDGGDSTTQSIASAPSSNSGWTKEQDNFLMNLKAQGLGYSAIQDEMRKEFGWTRNKNVLVKRFAVLKKRCKPQIKTRVSMNHLHRLLQVINAVSSRLFEIYPKGLLLKSSRLWEKNSRKLPLLVATVLQQSLRI